MTNLIESIRQCDLRIVGAGFYGATHQAIGSALKSYEREISSALVSNLAVG
jgi:hypothetical protein